MNLVAETRVLFTISPLKKKKKKKTTTNNEITEFRMSYQFHSNVDVGVHYTTENISSISIQIDKYMRSKGKPTTVQKVKT